MMTLAFDPREGSYLPCALVGLAAAVLVLRADLRRRKIAANPYLLAGIAGVAALAAWLLFRQTGIAGFAALVAWSVAIALRAAYEKVAVLEFLDAGSPAAAASIAAVNVVLFLTIGTIGSVTASGSVQLMPLYECLVWSAIAAFLWRMSARASLGPRPKGEIFAILLMLFGVNGFITEWVLLPSVGFAHLSQLSPAHFASIGTFAVGGILLGSILSRYHGVSKEHRILEHAAARGNVVQPEYRKPTPECPHPERWRMYDSMTAEVEVLEFLRTLVTATKPDLVVETGTFLGISTLHIAEGLQQNGFGRVITCEFDAKVYEEARKRFAASGLDQWIELRNESSLEIQINGRIDLLYCDSDMPLREQEVRRFLPQMNPNGLIVLHDASSDLKIVRQGALKLEREGLISVIFLPTPRGLVVGQKREGRT